MTALETYASLAEADRAMGPDAAYLGGGTVLMRAVNYGEGPARLLRARDPALGEIRVSGDRVALGAGVTMAQILAHRALEALHPVARAIGGPQIRNMATVGGNLFAPHPYGDMATALLALGARATLAGGAGGGAGDRPLDDLLRDRGRSRPPLVESVSFAPPRAGDFGFRKVARVKPRGVSVLCVAALLPMEGGRARGARIAWGAMGPAPLRGAAAERALEGRALDAETIRRAAEVAADGLDPPTDALATAWWRRETAGVHLGRLLASMGGR